ncbi:hypothetical protein KBY58_03900 [Cyanobium sp. HWJ4-Hawea]|nr:hypothetical protein [Cyanobium sp. HWJ4-Hawea]MCP9808575.1 hypothetical protein [Cyanobium sp. HWJ4-Hawea]
MLFTTKGPLIRNFHGYPWHIRRLTHVFPAEPAMNNQIDRWRWELSA